MLLSQIRHYAPGGSHAGEDGTGKIFSTLDLAKGYYQVPLAAHHREKTAFVTEWGKFQFTVMPFGLRNAQATFQCLMDVVLHDIFDFARCYIDDICVFSDTWTNHLDHLRQMFQKLKSAELTLQLPKLS